MNQQQQKYEKRKVNSIRHEWNALIKFGSDVAVHLTREQFNLIMCAERGSLPTIIVRFKL